MGERKHKDGFSFKPFCTLVFSCNKVPKNYNDRSDAFFGRLILLKFANTIPVEKQDKLLKEKLAAEIDGILAWALVGLKRLMANNYVFSETERTRDELKQYMMESSAVLAFVDEYCTLAPDAVCFREDLFNAFSEYNSNSKTKMSQTMFNRELSDQFPAITRSQMSNRKAWKGIHLL